MATICCASTSSGLRGMRVVSIAPSSMRRTTTAASSRSPRYLGNTLPTLVASTVWPARPMRCRPLATEMGDSTCTTRSIAPMSMPSSSELVATRPRSVPAFKRFLDGQALLAGDRAVVRAHEDGRCRLVFSLGELVETLGQAFGQAATVDEDERRALALDELQQARVDRTARSRCAPRAPATEPPRGGSVCSGCSMSSSGTTTSRSSFLRWPASTSVTGRSVPPRKRPISSSGRWVADRPMRCKGPSTTCSRRSSDSARCAPRLVPAIEWISSTMTQRTLCRISSARDVSSRYSDSGVVIRMSGGVRAMSRRSRGRRVAGAQGDGDVGRRLTQALRGEFDAHQRRLEVALDVVGERLERRDVQHATAPLGVGGGWLRRQPIDAPQERRQRLARPRRGLDERVLAAGDGLPTLRLGGRGRAECVVEPLARRRRKSGQHDRGLSYW